jgi:hypothetical protein
MKGCCGSSVFFAGVAGVEEGTLEDCPGVVGNVPVPIADKGKVKTRLDIRTGFQKRVIMIKILS